MKLFTYTVQLHRLYIVIHRHVGLQIFTIRMYVLYKSLNININYALQSTITYDVNDNVQYIMDTQ